MVAPGVPVMPGIGWLDVADASTLDASMCVRMPASETEAPPPSKRTPVPPVVPSR
jgi:hypothetical protein